ncbi:hypothetical protein [Maritalea porphyrae]|jgi:cytoskeletal protein CcmA (bactofilin family)|uniref:hypothetical protein n=1 Tax=Maritalea porphyrae TaxID=880732 RepID=UPI0022AF62FF|nr:hypothetical protein [Maritalea porphyrae]MCZ4273486.1 hypothetical protein [Maritalea porphyrae]
MRFTSLILAFLAILITPILAQESKEERLDFGGDIYIGAESPEITNTVANDVFATGYKPTVSATVNGDVHAAGFEVIVDGDVMGNTYAFGNMVRINGATAKDVTSSGSSVRIDGEVGGNVRAAGADVTINAPVLGSVLIGAARFDLNANVKGDVSFSGDRISFGEGAKVDGALTIRSTRDDIKVPASVASADRVTIEKITQPEMVSGMGDVAKQTTQGLLIAWVSAMLLLLILPIVGIIWLALFPKRSQIAYEVAIAKPFKSIFFGMLGVAMFIGLIPVLGVTLIGIPLIPVAIVMMIVSVFLGYIAGAWFLAARVLEAFGFEGDTLAKRAIAMVAGIILAFILGLIPFIGWLIGLLIGFIGLGGILFAYVGRTINKQFHEDVAAEVDRLA